MNIRTIVGVFFLLLVACLAQAQQSMSATEDIRNATGDAGLSVVINQNSPVIGCGEPVTLTATVTGATEISWKRNGEFITGATTNTFVANQSGVYTVVAVSLLCQLESAPVEVILQSPLNAAIVAPEGAEACAGEAVVLQATGGTAQWQWYRDGEALADGLNETYTATEAGSYVVVGNENSPCTSASAPIEVIIHPLPEVSLVWENDPVICAGDSLTATASLEENLAFSWYWEEIFLNVEGSSYTAALAGEYHALVTDTQTGCSSTTNSIVLNVWPQQEVEISIDGNPWMCEGEASVLVVTSGEGSVQWLADGNVMEGFSDFFLNVFDGAEYTARITDMNGCSVVSNSLTMQLLPIPNAGISIQEGVQNLCGTSDTLHLEVEEGNAYVWYAGDVVLEGEQGSVLEVVSPGDYTVEVTNSDGCVAISDVSTIAMVDVPEALLIPEDGVSICMGQTVLMEIISAQGVAFTWYLNGEELPFASDVAVEVNSPGDYSVLVTDEYGCQSLSPTTTVYTVEVTTPVITDGGTTTGGQLLITDNASGHQWYLNGEMIPGATGSEYLATEGGVYTVIAIEDVCESALSEGFEVVLGAVNQSEYEGLSVYPNPCAERMSIVFGETIGEAYVIYDAMGQLMYTGTAAVAQTMVDVSAWSSGVYTLVSAEGERVLVEVVR